ncbi:MAG: flagellar biosynthesis protein FlhB [Alphaproteobacteria bacterium]|nr:flagellar biosynthesis protein FlhB [Alphaproteobacteria bacterium]
MAEEDDDSQKTEDPTAKRLSDAREQGNLPISRDVATWTLLLGIVMCVAALFPTLGHQMMMPLTAILEKAGEMRLDNGGYQSVYGYILGAFGPMVMAIICLLMLMGIIGWLVQTGLMFNPGLLKLKWERLDAIAGFKRLFSVNSLVELLKSIGKILVVGSVASILITPIFYHTESMTGISNDDLIGTTYNLSSHIIFSVFLVFTLIAFIDLVYQRFTYHKNMRMTKQEVKDENRQSEGDPHVKGRLRQIRTEKARKRMMAAVPKADVIITNPTHYAIALQYDPMKMAAPVCIAKGADFVAQKIREVATTHKVPIVSNPPLARALFATVEVDDEVPPEHYRAVAEVISYIYRLKKFKPPPRK